MGFLTEYLILTNYKSKIIHFNFPENYDLKRITNLLYEKLSKQIFSDHADLTAYSVGDKLTRKGEGRNIYVIKYIDSNIYNLVKENDISNLQVTSTFDKLKRNYIQIKQSTRNGTLSKFEKFFKKENTFGFLPTHFAKKLVLIAGRTMWNNLGSTNCIPSIYLSHTRDVKSSIPALEDCIAFITPEYALCYEELLRKNIEIDIILICDTDLNNLPQIIHDKAKYHFKLIVLSKGNGAMGKLNNILLWNWQKEEIALLEGRSNTNIEIGCIEDEKLDNLILHFEECMQYVSSLEIPIKLKSYGYFLRLALNALQDEQFEYLLMRLKSNKDLERNEGGYEDFADKSPKEALNMIIEYLKEHNPKQSKLEGIITACIKNTLIVADKADTDFLRTIRNNKCKIVTNAELKKLLKNEEILGETIVFYSFNGAKDFGFIYNLLGNVRLVLYKEEKDMYCKQLQINTRQLEAELTSGDRFAICGVKYKPIPLPEIKSSPTLEQIIERLEQRSNTAYEGYKNESDNLLDDLEEEITYKFTFTDNSIVELGSNETVFDVKGNLIKSYKFKIGNKIRIYPKEKFAENLLQIAIEVETEKFGMIDEHSVLWQNALKSLDAKYGREKLYSLLEQNGLKVLSTTVDAYFRGACKFPMFNRDLQAILILSNNTNVFNGIKKSKRLYNSTMIALGRGVKQELQQFLKDKTVGEILQKKNFTADALQQFISEYMPLLTITKIEEISDEQ
jgi:hypothetical protein